MNQDSKQILGAALALSLLTTGSVSAISAPQIDLDGMNVQVSELESSAQLLANEGHCGEGKCGEGHCGDEGHCGGHDDDDHGHGH